MANKGQNDLSQFKYAAMSNLVLQADRRFVSRRGDENTGDPESLAGRITIHDMGARGAREDAPKQKVDRANMKEDENILRQQKKRKRGEAEDLRGQPVLGQSDFLVEGLKYKPRTPATRSTYALITTIVGRALGDVPNAMVMSAADFVLETLKNEEMKDFDKKKEIDEVLGTSLTSKEFNEVVNLGKKITDYDAQDDDDEDAVGEAPTAGPAADGTETNAQEAQDEDIKFDQRNGVAVVFGDEDDEDGQTFEVKDGDSSDEETGEEDAAQEVETDGAQADEEGGLVFNVKATDGDTTAKLDKGLIPAHEIDAYWLQRQIGQIYQDAHETQEKTREALHIMSGDTEEENSLREIENDLMELFDYEHDDFVGKLVLNRDRIVWVTRWQRAAGDRDARTAVEREMVAAGHRTILNELRSRDEQASAKAAAAPKGLKLDLMDVDMPSQDVNMDDADKPQISIDDLQPQKLIDLNNLVFEQGNHLNTNPRITLPQGSVERKHKGYSEYIVPPPKRKRDANEVKNIPTSDLPDWARVGFGSSKELNRIQTRCYPTAFNDDGNMLICAPTGSGKTNVAMLTMLREIGKHRNPETGEIALDDFKIVYIAPLKALVQEQVGNFGKRLEPYGIKVSELTGDRQLTKAQIAETQVIVTTPEKWDVITRKASDTSYTNLVRLICIDEIHLLHDDRGPVLESIVSRTIRRMEQTGHAVRLVGLSATLPNYRDVANFLRVDPVKGMFHFDGTFRPCPLGQEFVGVADRSPIKQLRTMNEVCYNKILDQTAQNYQTLVFVHSRKETAKTAKYIRDKALEMETIGQIMRTDAGSSEILRSESETVQNPDLKDVMQYGFGIHHAGMSRADRNKVEELFADGHLQVLVCTATLAWGVNLPAHTVIIKGTTIYSPEKGTWVELSPQDVLQMLGRAGRPQYDSSGLGIIITTQSEIQYYISLMNQQLPIESQFMSKLADNLNAEIVLGSIRSRKEAVEWLGYTYLFVRMLRSPGLYGVGADYENDDFLLQIRVDLVHSAAAVLEKCGLVKYEKKSGKLTPTELGRIASHYYITHNSMHTYNQHIQPSISTIELFRVFALSEEFKYIPVRQEEKLELAQLLSKVPIPVKEGIEEPQSKINVLLQAYISRLKFEGLALMADLVYVTQSAGRILRAIFEISLKKGWSSVTKLTLDLCKMAEKRMWPTMSPLRQFPNAPRDIVNKAERLEVPFSAFFDLDPPRMGELLGMPRHGKVACDLMAKFPRLSITAQAQPMTRSMLRVDLTLTPNFTWDPEVHGAAEGFWILVEDVDGEEILFHDQFMLRREFSSSDDEHLVEFTVPITEPMQPHIFITVLSDRWMNSESKIAVSFQKLILPGKFPAHTPLLDLQPLTLSAFKDAEYQSLYEGFDRFNKVQTQTFNALFSTDDSVFIGAATGIGKTICAEFAILRQWSQNNGRRSVYIAPTQEQIDARFQDWHKRLTGIKGGKEIVKFSGDMTTDLKILEKGDLILATPLQWDSVSRQWQRRKNVQNVGLFIADDLHMLGGHGGFIYEMIVSRMHAMSLQLESDLRIIGLSVSLADARDIGEWIGASKHTIFNFSPHVRAVPLELHIQPFTIPHFPSLMLAMARPVYQSILQLSPDKPAMVFVPNRKQARNSALDLLAQCVADDTVSDDPFLHTSIEELSPLLAKIGERALAESLTHGIGYYHEALSSFDKRAVEHLFKIGAIQVMLVSRDSCWEISSTAHLVIIQGTQYYEGREHRYIDYRISDVLQMFGKAGNPANEKISKGVLMVPAVKREYYKKFLNEALPIESHLGDNLHDAFVSEISTQVIASTQDALDWSTYSFFYRRLLANPSFYGVADASSSALNDFMSDTVEATIKQLAEAKIIEHDEDEDTVTPLNAAMIAAYYNISYVTMQTFLLSLSSRTKLKGILEIVSSAVEFENIPIRRHEDRILNRIYERVPVKMAEGDFNTPHFKTFILLQAHFSRMSLPVDLAKDQEEILKKTLPLLSACVDVLSSEGHLNAMHAMEMSQMTVQAMWDRDSPLKQIPHFDDNVVDACKKFGVNDIFEFMDAMDPSENKDYEKLIAAMRLSKEHLGRAANFTNEYYPNVELEFEVLEPESITSGEPSHLGISITREIEEDEEPKTQISAPFFPVAKTENWWILVGEEKTKNLLAVKRITFGREYKGKLEYTVPTAGKQELTLYLMSDCYVGIDQAPTFAVDVAQGEDDDDEDEEEVEDGDEMEE